MKTSPAPSLQGARQAIHEAKGTPATMARQEFEDSRRLIQCEMNSMEAAALLVLLGNELSRAFERGDTNTAEGFGQFIALGLDSLTQRAAQRLHAAHWQQPQPLN
jgi:hypothetical protein